MGQTDIHVIFNRNHFVCLWYSNLKNDVCVLLKDINIFKYWHKIVNLPNTCLFKTLNKILLKDIELSPSLVKNMLEIYGLRTILLDQNNLLLNIQSTLFLLKQSSVSDINL